MTLEKAIEFGKIFLKSIENEKGSATYEFVEMAVKALKQQSTLDKIRAEIKALSNANPSYWHCGDMVERDEVFDIIDKYIVSKE